MAGTAGFAAQQETGTGIPPGFERGPDGNLRQIASFTQTLPNGQAVNLPRVIDAASAGAAGAGAVPASMRSLASAAGYGSSGASGGGTDIEAERLRMAGENAGIANREDTQSHELELARLRGTQGLDSMQKAEDFKRTDQASADANMKSQQDRMLGLIQPFLTQSHVTPPSEADDTAAQNAAFARAKDRTANIARSSLLALRASATERGINVAGGTNPALLATEGRLMSDSAQPLSDLVRQQAIDQTSRAHAVADRNYAGALQEEGQRNSLVPSLLSLVKMSGAVY